MTTQDGGPTAEAPQLRPLGVGDVVDRVFSLYRARPLLFLTLSAIPYLALFLVIAGLAAAFAGSFFSLMRLSDELAAGREPDLRAYAGAFGSLGAFVVAAVIVAIVFLSVQTTALVDAMSARYLGRATDVGASFRHGLAAAPRVVGTGLVLFVLVLLLWMALGIVMALTSHVLVVVVGMLFGFAATVYILASALVAPVAATVEGAGPIHALRRSWVLSDRNRWRVLGVQFLLGILNVVISALLSAIFLAGFVGDPLLRAVLQQVANVLATVAWAPVQWGTFTVLYYDLRVRREAFDLQLAAEALPRAP